MIVSYCMWVVWFNLLIRFYATVKSDDIGEEYHRDVWRKNPVTSVIVDTVHPKS